MGILAIIGLSVLAIVVGIGIIRVIIRPSDGFLDFFCDLFLLDILIDCLEAIVSVIGGILDD